MDTASDSVFSSIAPEETIKRLDEHIQKVETICPSGNPDPSDPKRMPQNKSKRKSVDEAIKRGEDALSRWGSS